MLQIVGSLSSKSSDDLRAKSLSDGDESVGNRNSANSDCSSDTASSSKYSDSVPANHAWLDDIPSVKRVSKKKQKKRRQENGDGFYEATSDHASLSMDGDGDSEIGTTQAVVPQAPMIVEAQALPTSTPAPFFSLTTIEMVRRRSFVFRCWRFFKFH